MIVFPPHTLNVHGAVVKPRHEEAQSVTDDDKKCDPTVPSVIKKPKSNKRRMTHTVAFRLKDADYLRLERTVTRSGHDKVNDWVRTTVLSASGQCGDHDVILRRLSGNLSKIGSHIGKMLSQVHKNDDLELKSDLQITLNEMRDVLRKIAITLP